MIFNLFIVFIIVLRMGELIYTRKNRKWMLQHDALEYDSRLYSVILGMHILFIVSLLVEYGHQKTQAYSTFLLAAYFLLLGFKIWTLSSIGNLWCQKTFRMPELPIIRKGPYKFMNHPNYIIVVGEVLLVSLAFHLYYTACIFTILHIALLYIRIKEEDKALKKYSKILSIQTKQTT
ncbi:MAG TPA: isoprenylcysteine carboxylmethyltransferase family protein [Bacteroidia bacterium]|nr:isoprenylcysteine carboxylmethyltransferase family protein [Bacteroidia bacterium]